MSTATPPARSRAPHRTAALTAAAVTGALLLTGCSATSSSSGGGGGDAGSASDLHALLPAQIRSAGVLRIGADLTYAPIGFKAEGGAPDGLDVDLANALGGLLGVKVQFSDVPFDRLRLGLQAHEYDLVMSGMTDNPQRRDGTDDQARKVNDGLDFVDYFVTGTSIVVAKGNPQKIAKLDDLCGKTVALQRDTVQAVLVERQVGACQKTGRKLTVTETETDDQALALVAQGKAAADLNDTPVAQHAVKNGRAGGQFQVVGPELQVAPYGIAFAKEDSALRDAMVKALDQLIRSGEYDKVLAKWGLGGGAVQSAVVNGSF
ncbi:MULTISPECIES: ABC transporter substrate-binding protein [Kitasatospora]|uniref:Putative ABC transporter substrate-binding protein n=1 Tax=Kitasatospora setae (strain ATCC 33774 / DSM 43861 / JCM 3304 / KCC A-0304 / NBRC 14216 / KM-6054) TaxID=452652 RepID=E4NGV4_KITSK|nr:MULTISPECIES: ABC transporter substrate-binding protein [Kitasatospora]BAJ30734.1 putative ABC transporter substrate-binding protein [Kitasatospora setae KM-6054]